MPSAPCPCTAEAYNTRGCSLPRLGGAGRAGQGPRGISTTSRGLPKAEWAWERRVRTAARSRPLPGTLAEGCPLGFSSAPLILSCTVHEQTSHKPSCFPPIKILNGPCLYKIDFKFLILASLTLDHLPYLTLGSRPITFLIQLSLLHAWDANPIF